MRNNFLRPFAALSLASAMIATVGLLTSCDDDDDDDGVIAASTVSDSSASGTAGTNSDEYVDLGLSVKWARYNVGASTPDDYGDYFTWGETLAVSARALSPYDDDDATDFAGDATYDAATAEWGDAWKTPTKDQLEELKSNCIWEWGTYDGTSVKGFLVTGSNGNSIFLPAAGYQSVTATTTEDEDGVKTTTYSMSTSYSGTTGYYQSSTPNTSDTDNAYFLHLYNCDSQNVADGDRSIGRSVRPVTE